MLSPGCQTVSGHGDLRVIAVALIVKKGAVACVAADRGAAEPDTQLGQLAFYDVIFIAEDQPCPG